MRSSNTPRSGRCDGDKRKTRNAARIAIEAVEPRLLLTQRDVFPNMTFDQIKAVVDSAGNGDLVLFHTGTYSFPDRLPLHGADSAPGIEYRGETAATYSGLDGTVTNPGTVITKPGMNQHDHYAFDLPNDKTRDNIQIDNLTFDACGIAVLNGSASNFKVINNLCRNAVPDSMAPPDLGWDSVIRATYDLSNSQITNNVFKNTQITYGIALFGGGGFNSNTISNNIFSDCDAGIELILSGGALNKNSGDTVSGNVGIRLRDKLIEIQGDTATNLVISGNKVSDFSFHDDSTFGLSVPINGPWVSGMQVTNNEVSDIPGVGIPDPIDHLAGVRLGLEVGGPTDNAINAVGTIISGNKLYGTVVPISLTGGWTDPEQMPHNLVDTTVENNTIVYYTGSTDDYGVSLDQANPPVVESGLATKELPTGITNTPVAFDAWVTGDGTHHTFAVGPDGVITMDQTTTVGRVRDNSDTPGLGPGRAVIYGMGGNNTMSADTSTNPTVLSRSAFAGGVGAGSTPVTESATLLGGAGTDTLFGGTSDDVLTLDMGQASHFPANTITVGQRVTTDGGAGSGGMYTFNLVGSSGNDQVIFNSTNVQVPVVRSVQVNVNINELHVQNVTYDGLGPPIPDMVVINGGPTVTFPRSQFLNYLVLNGTASAAMKAGMNSVLYTQNLNMMPTTKLDLADEDMIIDYSGTSPLASSIRPRLVAGRNNGAWHAGAGITTWAETADPERDLGYGENSALNKSSFDGFSVDSTAILIKYTYGGDANLDGMVDVTDLGILATNYDATGAWNWYQGDFNYDTHVNVTDLGILATNWQLGVGDPLGPQQSGGSTSDFWAIVDTLHLTKKQRDAIAAVLGANSGGPTL